MIKNEWEKYAYGHLNINSNTLDAYTKFNSKEIENMTPYVLEERQMRYSQIDIFSRLMADRIIFLGQGINDEVANIVTGQLLFLESSDPKRDVQLYLNSGGGGVYAGLGIYDTMQLVKPDVGTICTGIAASMAAVLMCAGAPGKRSALKHSRIMIHQPLGGASGQASDMQITVNEINKLKKELYDIISEHSGKTYEDV
jgi:ATP-dependent Clp protease, protease subunit